MEEDKLVGEFTTYEQWVKIRRSLVDAISEDPSLNSMPLRQLNGVLDRVYKELRESGHFAGIRK